MITTQPDGGVAVPGARRGIVLRWQSDVIEELVAAGPSNQTDVVAVAAASVRHANADGGRMEAGMRTLAREAGLYHGRAKAAADWLIDHGWWTFEVRIAHGGRRFRLTIPDRAEDGDPSITTVDRCAPLERTAEPQRSGSRDADSVRGAATLDGQRSGQRSGSRDESPTSDFPSARAAASPEAREAARRLAVANGARNPDAYARRLLAEDDHGDLIVRANALPETPAAAPGAPAHIHNYKPHFRKAALEVCEEPGCDRPTRDRAPTSDPDGGEPMSSDELADYFSGRILSPEEAAEVMWWSP